MQMPFISPQWKPVTVSIASFLLMALVVVGIGLLSGNHIVRYLEERVVQHGLEHHRDVLKGALALLEHAPNDRSQREQALSRFQAFSGQAPMFGIRIFLIDRETRQIVADSEFASQLIEPAQSILSDPITRLDGEPIKDLLSWRGPAWRKTEEGGTELLLLQPVTSRNGSDSHWILGISGDLGMLAAFMSDLHWHLDTVLLLTYSFITVFGFLVLRRVGRAYESELEEKVIVRTRELETAHTKLLDQTRLAAIGQTTSLLAHEMRNPLASIKLALSTLAKNTALGEREQRRSTLILGEVDRLEGMLSETLDYVRPVRLSEEPQHLDQLLDKVIQLELPLLEEKKLRLSRAVCSGCPPFRMDVDHLQQALLNLFKNAVDAAPPGSEINISLFYKDREFRLEVGNHGEPMSTEALHQAFEPFYTTKAKGTGLGLWLVKRVTEEHGGTVVAQSDAVNGTRICLRFPLPG